MVLILETSNQQAVKAIVALAKALKIQVRIGEQSDQISESKSTYGQDQKWLMW
jgi:hypothetical protein